MNEQQEIIDSVKYGLCQFISENGLSPSQLEEILSKSAFDLKSLSPLPGAMGTAFTLALGGGALAGVGTAALRHKVENMGNGTEDSAMRKNRMKIEMYKKMIADLKTDQTALPA